MGASRFWPDLPASACLRRALTVLALLLFIGDGYRSFAEPIHQAPSRSSDRASGQPSGQPSGHASGHASNDAPIQSSDRAANQASPPFAAKSNVLFAGDEAPWFRRPFDVLATDMDLDGDPDVLINWHHHEPLQLFENLGGRFVLANPVGDDPSGLYDNRDIPWLFADRASMHARIEERGVAGLYLWHDENRGDSWRFRWVVDPEKPAPLDLGLETSLEIVDVTGLETDETRRSDDRHLSLSLPVGSGARDFSIRVRGVAHELELTPRPTANDGSPAKLPVFVGPDMASIARSSETGPISIWKPDPHGIAWVDAAAGPHPDLFITRGGLGGNLLPPANPKQDRFFIASNDNPVVFRRAATISVPAGYERGRHVEWVDVGGDQAPELAIANEKSPNTILMRVPGSGNEEPQFRDVAAEYGLALEDAAVQAWSDLDGDGRDDLFFLTTTSVDVMKNTGGGPFKYLRGSELGLNVPAVEPARGLIDPTTLRFVDYDNDGDLDLWLLAHGRHGNTRLFRRDGAGFTDVTVAVGLAPATATRSVALLDVDNDGFEDAVGFGPTPSLWRNQRGERFTVTMLGADAVPAALTTAAPCDVDGDGRIDLVAAGRQRHLLHNITVNDNGYLSVDLSAPGEEPNSTSPIGAIVKAHFSDGTARAQRVGSATSTAFSQSILPLHFGIPEGTQIESLTVRWPGDTVERKIAVSGKSRRLRLSRE